jgi:hypothetical protein
MAAADADTRDVLHALVDCNAANCPPGSPTGCQSRFCEAELLACRSSGGEPAAPEPAPAGPAQVDLEQPRGAGELPSVMVGMMFQFGFAYAAVVDQAYDYYNARGALLDAFLFAGGLGWDANWLAGPPTSAPVFNAGVGLDIDLRYDGDDVAVTPAGYFYFHYFFANDLTDGSWTFFGLGVRLDAGWNDKDGWPFVEPQGIVAFRWLGAFTMQVEGFVGPEMWFPNDMYVGVVAGLRLGIGFQVDGPAS